MKNILRVLFLVSFAFALSNCSSMYRVYNDDDLEVMAESEYNFDSVLFFKIVDVDTAMELTGQSFQNSGVVYGTRNGQYMMIFVPKLTSKETFVVNYQPIYDVNEVYELLHSLEDESGQDLFVDPSGDYGGLSISVSPYESILDANPGMQFDSPIFFIVTTDTMVFHVGRSGGNYVVFDEDYSILNQEE